MKKRSVYIAILLGICLMMSGCVSKEKDHTKSECVYWTINEKKKSQMEEKAKLWNEANPDKQINMEIRVYDREFIDEKLWSALHSGILQLDNSVPDIVDIEYQDMEKYVPPYNCLLYPLNGIVDKYEEKYGKNNIFDGFTYRGIRFGIPEGSGEMVVVYQTDVLNANGIDYQSIASMDDFLEVGEEFYEKTGNYLCSIDMEHYYFFLSLFLQERKSESNLEIVYERTMEKIEELYQKKAICMMEGGRSSSRSFVDAFLQGKIASVYLPVTAVDDFLEKTGEVSCEVAKIPGTTVSIPEFATAVTIVSEEYGLMQEFLNFAKLEGELAKNQEFEKVSDLITSNTERLTAYIERYELELAKKLLEK